MKNLLIIFLIIGNAFNVFSQWNTLNSGTSQYLSSVYFLNDSVGFVGGGISHTTFLKTDDGGFNWTPININTIYSIHSIQFIDSLTGIMTTDGPFEGFKTTDGGTTWNQFNTGLNVGGVVYYKNADTIFIFYRGNTDAVSYSYDGGSSWTRFNQGTFGTGISSMNFPSPNSKIGYACAGYIGKIFKTYDGGVSWNEVAKPTSEVLLSIFFESDTVGYVSGRDFILKTTDGGLNWTTINLFGAINIQKVSSKLFFLCSDTIRYTTDGGLTYISMTGTTSGFVRDFHILSENSGYAVGLKGALYKLGSLPSMIDEKERSNINVYPNPTNGKIKISIPSTNFSVEVISIAGQIVKTVHDKSIIDLIDLPAGIYILRISSGNEVTVKLVDYH